MLVGDKLLSSEQEVQECDATELNSKEKVDYIIIKS